MLKLQPLQAAWQRVLGLAVRPPAIPPLQCVERTVTILPCSAVILRLNPLLVREGLTYPAIRLALAPAPHFFLLQTRDMAVFPARSHCRYAAAAGHGDAYKSRCLLARGGELSES